MSKHQSFLLRLQLAVYLIEVLVTTGLFALAASSSPHFALGPLARLLVAASLPLPCHLIWLAHFLWNNGLLRRRQAVPAFQRQPLPQALPVSYRSALSAA